MLLLCVALIGYLSLRHRDDMLRLCAGLIVRLVYRVRSTGLENIPQSGPALVVANHVSYTDAFVLGGLAPRPIRFVVYHRIYDAPALNWFFRLTRAIPIAPRSEDPKRMQAAFDEIDAALARGEVVGIFPEGRLTRDGSIGRFRSGIDAVLERRPVPVLPVALRGLWGSLFSYRYGKPGHFWPRRIWSRVEAVAGRLVKPEHASAQSLEAEVRRLHQAPTDLVLCKAHDWGRST